MYAFCQLKRNLHNQTQSHLINQDLGLNLAVAAKEVGKQLDGVSDVRRAARLADAVHAELGIAQVERAHAQLGGQARPDGAAAGRIVADDEELQRDAGLAGALLEHDDAGRVCGVALVGIDLDDGAAVDGGLVGRLVFAGVVGVDGVGHVGGHEERAGERLLVGRGLFALVVDVLVAAVAGGVTVAGQHGQASQHGRQQVGVSSLCRLGANLLVVEADGQADGGVGVEGVRGADGGDEALDGAVGHAQVVEAGREDELVVDAANDGLLRVVEHQLKVDNGGHVDAGLVGNHVEHGRVVAHRQLLQRLKVLVLLHGVVVGLGLLLGLALVELGGGETRNGEQLNLVVGLKVCLAVQMDGERGDAQQRLVHLDELLDDVVALAHHDAAGETQVAVEPRVPDAAAVRLDADLQVPDVALLGDGLDAQAGRVGVGADDGDGVAGPPFAANGKGQDGRAVAGEVVLAAGAEGRCPRVALADEGEAGLFEEGRGRFDGVVGLKQNC